MRDTQGEKSTGHDPLRERSECEHTFWGPKNGDLCLNMVKPGETMVESRCDSDVQIDCQIWVKGQNTNQTI